MKTIYGWEWNRRRLMMRLAAAGVLVGALSAPRIAAADDEAPKSWSSRYEDARRDLVEGRYDVAEEEFLALAPEAPSPGERRLAIEMARIAATWAAGEDTSPRPPTIAPSPTTRRPRSRDEITMLYATSFLYGAGTGAWFLLQTQPDTALTATLPFIGITAAPVITLALIDGHAPLPYGVPHAIASGMFLGLGESMLVVSYEHARAHRVYGNDADTKRWQPEEVASVLWGGTTLGGIAGGAIGFGMPTTPGRVSFASSVALWGGLLTGFTVGAVLPENDSRTEHAILGAGLGYNAGLVGGMMTAAVASPSVMRVRLVDLCGVAGGFAAGGTYLALARGGDSRAAMGITGAGAAAGLAGGWFATRSMAPDQPAASTAPQIAVQPSIVPVAGGGMIGVTGTM